MARTKKSDDNYFAIFGYQINRTSQILAAIFEDNLSKFSVTLPVWRVIWCINMFGTMSLSELASHCGFEMSWLTRIVSSAEEKNLVARKKDKNKKSIVRVSLTPEGQALIREILPVAKSVARTVLVGVPEQDIEATTRTLMVMYENAINNVDTQNSDNKKLIIARRTIGRAKPKNR